ncbi:Phosphatidylinositol transfer protein sfh5 [Escovopsis weberi]|uniref:Phosphatidylinositol transfer protein SFH5 n=1 Tax=Escovopsis weberi TaxID=150374 RepID=A0A0M9VWA9_ESCWE|nr:Phosphatidylinositol transfer protein sfh5 [Escovopsis weberi]
MSTETEVQVPVEAPQPDETAAAAAPAAAAPESPSTPEPPKTAGTPLSKLTERLDEITKQAEHGEMWGIELSSDSEHIPSQVILQKFLRANNNDVTLAEKQLVSALEWRKTIDPVALVEEAFDRSKFDGLGFITTHKQEDGKETVITWNIYGSVKDKKATFRDVSEFVKWRAALMELSVQQLHLEDATELIPDKGADPYQMVQVHDYQSVSFFRMDADVKAATKETIQTLSMAYPELMSQKYFVNVPSIMSWMFGALKFFLAPATIKKFHPLASGASLSNELKTIADSLPSEYGGQGPSVKEGMTVILSEPTEEPQTNGAAADSDAEEAADEEDAEELAATRSKEEAPTLPELNDTTPKTADSPPTLDGPTSTSDEKTDFMSKGDQKGKEAGEIDFV